jgi:HSCB C-terminal oligomerisation domain
MEQMELREALSEAQTQESVVQFLLDAEQIMGQCQGSLSQAFASSDLELAAALALRLTYLLKLVEDARGQKSRITKGR